MDDATDDANENANSAALEMSDEAFLAMGDEGFSDHGDSSDESAAAAGDDEADGEDANEDTSDEFDESAEDDSDETSENDTDDDASENGESDSEAEEDAADDEAESDNLTSQDFMEQVIAPFTANGHEMSVETPEDIRRLMMMGANYNKKMHGMKPHLKTLKTLEKNDLLDEDKLNFLIDLDKKNPEAIAKLLKDSKIDPRDIEFDEDSETPDYKSPNYTVGDDEMQLNEVLESINDSPHYDEILDIVGTKWDGKSRQTVAEQPKLLKVIHDHKASGVYDLISTEVDRARMFGRLDGMTDLQAYQSVGDQLHNSGGFKHLIDATTSSKTPAKLKTKPKADKAKLNAKKRAASPTKSSNKANVATAFDPLGMSDEKFEEFDARFI